MQRLIEHVGDAARQRVARLRHELEQPRAEAVDHLVQLGADQRRDAIDGDRRLLLGLSLDLAGDLRPRSTIASTGAASVSTPPTSVLTNRNTVVPSAPSANTDASYFSVSTLMSTLVSDGPSSPATLRATSRTFSLATWMTSSASRSSSAAISSPSASVHAFQVSWTKNDR